jgi:hypothetical protein
MRKHGSVWGFALLLVCAADPASAADAVFGVGSFIKTTAAAPTVQRNIPHGLGETPRAIIFWTSGHGSQGVSSGPRFSIGASDGPGSGRAVSFSARHNAGVTDTSRRMAGKALTIVQWSETLVAEADLVAWDASTFGVDWTSNDGTPMIIHFLAIGGTGVRARLVSWQGPAASGMVAVPIGFAPEVLLSFHAGADMVGVPPRTMQHALFGFSAAARGGGQWAASVASTNGIDIGGTVVSETSRVQATDSCLLALDLRRQVSRRAACAFTADGFTASFTQTDPDRSQLVTLALSGVSGRAGAFVKTRAPAPSRQPVRGAGFVPALFLMSSVMNVSSPFPAGDARWGIGVATASPAAGLTAGFADNDGTADATDAYGWMRNDRGMMVSNNETAAVNASATVTDFVPDGVDLTWNINDDSSTEITYLALAPAPPPPPDAAVPDAAVPDAAVPDTAAVDRPAADQPPPAPDAVRPEAGSPDAGAAEAPPVCFDECDAPVVRGPINLDVGCACTLGARPSAPAVPSALLIVFVIVITRRSRRH